MLNSKAAYLLFVVLGIMFFSVQTSAQNQAITETQLFYRKRNQIGCNLNTSGLGGINYRYGWHNTGKSKNILDIEFARIRHPKETRIYGQSEQPRKFTYGRLNMLFLLRTGLGKTIMITDRPYRNALSLNFNYNIGLSTAFLKPIYLDIYYPNIDGIGGYVSSERFDPSKPEHNNLSLIFGNSTFFEGINNTSVKLGAYGRASLSIEWGEYPEDFKSLEAGMALDVFPNPLDLMAFQPRSYFLFNFYLAYTYGWNK